MVIQSKLNLDQLSPGEIIFGHEGSQSATAGSSQSSCGKDESSSDIVGLGY